MKKITLLVLILCIHSIIHSKEKTISIDSNNITSKEAFRQLKKSIAPISFSFDTNIFEIYNKIDKKYAKKTIDENLKDLLPSDSLDEIIASNVDTDKKYTISGYVKEEKSGELLPGVAIYVSSIQAGVVSNGYGFYSLSLPEGTYMVTYSYLGFTTLTKEIVLDKDVNFDALLTADVTSLDEVVIKSEEKTRISKKAQMSSISIPIQQIQDLPALLGEKDVLKVFQLMPGVHSGAEGNAGLYVRGGGPDQNLIILDDATVYNANHLFGFFSVFNGDAVKSVEMYKGAFPARYGGRLSSVIDMRMVEGDKKEYHGKVGVGLLSSNLTVEGPIVKDKSSFLFSGRRSYIDVIAAPFMKKEEGKPIFNFYDLNLKLNYEFDSKNKLYLSGYLGRDNLGVVHENNKEKSKFKISWGNATTTLRWNHQFSPKLFANTSLVYSNYDLTIDREDSYKDNEYKSKYISKIRDLGVKYDMDFYLNPENHFKTGIQFTNHFFKPGAVVIKGTDLESTDNGQKLNSNEAAFYVEDQWKVFDKLKANIGFRVSYFKHKKVSYFKPEPRISLAYSIKEDLSIKASYASMNQYVHLLSSSGATLPTDLWVPSTENIKPQSSQQFAIGLAKDFTENNFSVSLEGYYKKSEDVIGYKEGANFIQLGGRDSSSSREFDFEENITKGQAWAYGGEFLLQKKYGRLTGWVGYTLSWSQRQFDEVNFGRKFNAKYDRRHDASIVGIYKLTDGITLSGNWIYGSGNNYTLNSGNIITAFNQPNDPVFNPNPGVTTTGYFSEKHNFKGESTHRLDLGIQFHKQKRTGKRTWEFSIYNVYNRKNSFFYYLRSSERTQQSSLKRVSLLGIIPSVSYKFEF